MVDEMDGGDYRDDRFSDHAMGSMIALPFRWRRAPNGRIERLKGDPMSRACELTGKAVQSGNNVSHANNKTRRRFLPNLCQVTLISDALGQRFRLRVSAHALRSVEHRGGLDAFLTKAPETDLSQRAKLLKRQIAKKTSATAEAA